MIILRYLYFLLLKKTLKVIPYFKWPKFYSFRNSSA